MPSGRCGMPVFTTTTTKPTDSCFPSYGSVRGVVGLFCWTMIDWLSFSLGLGLGLGCRFPAIQLSQSYCRCVLLSG